jgi:hypothetical protein
MKDMSNRKNSTPYIDNQYGFTQFNHEKLITIDGVDISNYNLTARDGPRDQIQLDIPERSTPLGTSFLKLPGIQSPTNNNPRLLTMKSLDSGLGFKNFLSPTNLPKFNSNNCHTEVDEIL